VILNRSVLICTAILVNLSLLAVGQTPPSYPQQQPEQQAADAPRLSPQDLGNLVAPIALYPDLLLSQILAASTYPAEITEAQQWMRSTGLRGQQLVEAAKQQPWDPSVQALVAFPEVMTLLTRDMQWTTDLGNAFLSQQADVMDAIQRLRASAHDNGRLTNTPQQRVTYEQQNGQNAIVIQPVDPQTVYVPVYNPVYVWGPPAYGYYPPLGYPGVGYGIGFGVGTFLGGLFSGFFGFGGWGWGFSWLSHGLFLNGLFFNHFGFHGYGGYGFHGGYGYASRAAWVHNPGHRLGVPYSGHYAGGHFAAAGNHAAGNHAAGNGGYASARSNNAGHPGYSGGSRQAEAYRGLSARSAHGSAGYSQPHSSARNNSVPASRYSGNASRGASSSGHGWAAPASHSRSSAGHYSAPKSSGHARGGGNGGGHSSGGHGHSGGGGGHSHGGGSHKK
jgi:hypothetical protein